MIQINLIITTKFYPNCNSANIVWNDFKKLYIEEDLSFNSSIVGEKYKFEFIKKRSIPNEEKTKSYDVYIVPCTYNTVLSKKMIYLNNVVKEIIHEQDADILKNTYLIAHDKDFINDHKDCFVLPSINEVTKYPYLGQLLEVRHIFLFQHDGKLNSILNRIPHTDDTALDFNSCEFLHKMADAHSRMIRHFNDINGDNHDRTKTKKLYPIQ